MTASEKPRRYQFLLSSEHLQQLEPGPADPFGHDLTEAGPWRRTWLMGEATEAEFDAVCAEHQLNLDLRYALCRVFSLLEGYHQPKAVITPEDGGILTELCGAAAAQTIARAALLDAAVDPRKAVNGARESDQLSLNAMDFLLELQMRIILNPNLAEQPDDIALLAAQYGITSTDL